MTQEIPGMMATLASYEGMFGPYHPQTLAITTALAVALCASSHRADGRRLLERAVGDLTKHHGQHHPVRIRALEAWSTLLCQEGDWQAALPVQRELLDCRTHLLGQDHPEALAVRNDLSATLSALNNGPWSISA
jgi:eukaryotic-like serine/threonine-protein kinase